MHPRHFLALLSQSLLWAPSSPFLQPHPSSTATARRSITGCDDGRCREGPREGRRRRPSAPSCRRDSGRHRTSERTDDCWDCWGSARRRPTRLCLASRPRSTDDDDAPREGSTQKRTRRRTPSTAADAKVITNGPTNGRPDTRANPSNVPLSTFATALAIIPPDHSWDALQRARHLARDTTFYRWPPAIRLFHPFAPKNKVPELVGKLAEFIDDEMTKLELVEILDEGMEWMGEDVGYYDRLEGMLAEMMERGVVKDEVVEGALDVLDRRLDGDDDDDGDDIDESGDASGDGNSAERINGDTSNNNDALSPATYLQSFEVTLDSIQILPHYEVLDARLEALEERMPQRTLGESVEERERRRRIEEGRALIEEEERRGLERKRERERKRRLKRRGKEGEGTGEGLDGDDEEWSEDAANGVDTASDNDNDGADDEGRPASPATTKNEYNGPCIIYLAPDDASKSRLDALRTRLKDELFGDYDAFSPGSSVSPYPECLPRNKHRAAGGSSASSTFRPLLPIGRFPNVESAVKVARVLQRTWDPLTFNVTDIQFVSRDEGGDVPAASGVGFGTNNLASTNHRSGHTEGGGAGSDMDIPEVRHRRKHGTLLDATDAAKDRMALTSSGEVDDVGRRGAYRCDAAVMLWGEELEEDVMEAEASLSMIVDDDDDDDDEEEEEYDGDDADDAEELDDEYGEEYEDDEDGGGIDYSKVFATAEREYQRMRAHEELSAANGEGPVVDADATTNLEAWLDGDDDEAMEDEGATVVVGRAQLFLGAHRDFVGMPASSAIDSKDRIMGGGVSATARRKGSVSRMTESWDAGDYGQKETDRRP